MSDTIYNPACADMELRDYIATAALPAIINWLTRNGGWTKEEAAGHAYDVSDAMLAARAANIHEGTAGA